MNVNQERKFTSSPNSPNERFVTTKIVRPRPGRLANQVRTQNEMVTELNKDMEDSIAVRHRPSNKAASLSRCKSRNADGEHRWAHPNFPEAVLHYQNTSKPQDWAPLPEQLLTSRHRPPKLQKSQKSEQVAANTIIQLGNNIRFSLFHGSNPLDTRHISLEWRQIWRHI